MKRYRRYKMHIPDANGVKDQTHEVFVFTSCLDFMSEIELKSRSRCVDQEDASIRL